MAHPSKDLLETQGTLRTVIESLIDEQEGFQKIAEALDEETLNAFFMDESLKRAEFRGELESLLHQEGVHDIHETGSPAGTVLRILTRLEGALGAGPHALLSVAEELENTATQTYDDALNKSLPIPVREVLVQQIAYIAQSREKVRAARKAAEI